MKTTPVLFIVIPCYNEQEALPIMAMRLVGTTDDMLSKSLIDSASRNMLADDGSNGSSRHSVAGFQLGPPTWRQ